MLLKDVDWLPLEGRICEVTNFTPFAKFEDGGVEDSLEGLPYATLRLRCRDHGFDDQNEFYGAVSHKLDFKLLWMVFCERGVADDETAVILWSKRNLKAPLRLVAAFMPRLCVTIFKAEAFRLMLDRSYRPELRGEERGMAVLPTDHWQHDVWKDRVISTRSQVLTSS